MLRRYLLCSSTVACSRFLTINSETRDNLTKHLTSLKEECKGQGLDLEDMRESTRAAAQLFQDAVKKEQIDDAAFKGKVATLTASVKAYNTRLANLQNEARSIQSEAGNLLKLMWGTENPQAAKFSSPPPNTPGKVSESEDFSVDPPEISKILEQEPKTPPKPEKVVEQVEAEVVKEKPKTTDSGATEEIEVETIEIEVEPEEATQKDLVDSMKITDITKELYEKGVNFSDCLDAQSLRQRYRDVLSGKIPSGGTTAGQSKSNQYSQPSGSAAPQQPRATQRPPQQQNTYQQQYQQPPPNTTESGITADPYPNAHRKMVDPMKYVREIKQELAIEKGIDPNSVDLWSGKTKLEDHKRIYDYPSVQSYPIEVRQKGDIPY